MATSFEPRKAYFVDGVCIPSRAGPGLYDLCGRGRLRVVVDGDAASGALGVWIDAGSELAEWPLDIALGVDALEFVAATNAGIYDAAWTCNDAYLGRGRPEDCASAPSNYPKRPSAELEVEKWWLQPWLTPYFSSDFKEPLPFTAALLASLRAGGYLALYTASGGDASAYIWEGWTLKVYAGRPSKRFRSWVLAYGLSADPYEAVRRAASALAAHANLKLRRDKPRPPFADYLGWCSWNAFLTEVDERGVVEVVRGLRGRGLPITWALIDDGWQQEERVQLPCCLNRVLKSLKPDPAKFPGGLSSAASSLKSLGVRWVGLWHTLNIHWGGYGREVEEELGVPGIEYAGNRAPPASYPESLALYKAFFKRVAGEGVDFVKVDNQCSSRLMAKYAGEYVGRAAAAVQTGLQLAAQESGLEVLNCMSMNPENYSNYFHSNLMRASNDYIPYWREGARLHALSNAYNSLFVSELAWPDFDMFSSYDPYAKLHLVLRVFSGGPIYITDRDSAKANVELLRMAVLPSGETVKVDQPAVPTRDILFRSPYKGEALLKLASTVRGKPAVALCNIAERRLAERLRLESLPYEVAGDYVYYKVFAREGGRGAVEVELEPLDCEVVVLSPPGLVGLAEYILPPYPVVDGRPIAPGTPVVIQ
ncbi:MAG: Sip1-related alpha-galactosidase [Thermoproteus sp. AZ2]|jgi:hypothetical protein|uniref:Sip1-related alpha-galactosidase n=1 Tax=Thermoproteus sp. AZ2 TaxID=1609232 RepID=A0ACC6UZS8_9CREN